MEGSKDARRPLMSRANKEALSSEQAASAHSSHLTHSLASLHLLASKSILGISDPPSNKD